MSVLERGHFALGITIGGLSVLLALLALGFLDIDLSEASFSSIIGTIIGATIAFLGSFLVIRQARQDREEDRKASDVATLHGILAKLIDLNDGLQKTKRHFMIHDRSSKVFIEGPASSNYFSKPLEGYWRRTEFDVKERTFLLRLRGGDFFSVLSDVNAISENFHFLRERHKAAYYELHEEVFAKEIERKDYAVRGELNPNSTKFMAMMDVDGLLRSFLADTPLVVEAFLKSMIQLSNEIADQKIKYDVTDNPPSSVNSMRQPY